MAIADISTLYRTGHGTPDQAMALFDALEPVDLMFMRGRWQGRGFDTGHAMDGMLENFNWYGKEFLDEEQVKPLLHKGWGGRLYSIHPGRLPLELALKLPFAKATFMRHLFHLMQPCLCTRQYRARLRMIEHRDFTTAAMVYDDLPIIDFFRKLDDDHLLGVMDLRGSAPFFFRLLREPVTGHQSMP